MNPNNVGSITYEARIDTSKMRSDAAHADSMARSVGSSFQDNIGGAITRVASSAAYLTTRLAILGLALGVLGKNALEQTSEFQQARIAFDTMLGSAEAGQKMLKNLSEFAKRTPFNLPEVVQGAKGLLAYGIAAENIIPTFNALGNIAAGVGRDKLPQLTLAYGQVATATKLTGMELRQFTEAGVPLLQALAQQSGKSAAQIKDDMEKGVAPSFEEVQKAIFSMSEKGGKFYNLMEKQSMTFAGRMSNIGDSVSQIIRGMLGVDVMGNVTPGSAFDRITKAAERLMVWLEANKARIIEAIQGIFDFIVNNGKPIAIFVGTILTAAFAAWAVSVVAATWPILAIAAAVTGLYLLYQRFKPQVDAVIAVFKLFWETIRPIREFIVNQLLTAWRDLSAAFEQIRIALAPFMPQLIMLAKIIGIALLIPLAAAVAGVIALITIFSVLIRVFASVVRAIVSVQEVLFSLWQTVIGTVAGIHKWFFNAGRDLIMGFVNGIKSAIGTVKDTLVGLTKKLTDWKGPLTLDKMILQKSGQAVMQGFVKGLESQYSSVQSSLSGLTKSLSTDVNTNFTSSGMRSIGSISNDSAPSNAPVNVELNMSGIMTRSRSDLRDVAKDMIRATNEELTAKGLQPIGDGAI